MGEHWITVWAKPKLNLQRAGESQVCHVKNTLFSQHAAGLGGFQHFQREIETPLCSMCVPSSRLGFVTENCPNPDSGDTR